MKFQRRCFHLCCAIKKSLTILFVSIALIILSLCLVLKIEENEVTSFFIGVIASIIATLVFRISDKYEKSISTCVAISSDIEKIVVYLEKSVTQNYNYEECWSTLWLFYLSICDKSVNLTYEADFYDVSSIISKLIQQVKSNADKITLYKTKEELVNKKFLFQLG